MGFIVIDDILNLNEISRMESEMKEILNRRICFFSPSFVQEHVERLANGT